MSWPSPLGLAVSLYFQLTLPRAGVQGAPGGQGKLFLAGEVRGTLRTRQGIR